MDKKHKFHIPVMGIGFTLDSPIKVAKYGISSVISLVDDTLIEEVRKYYCKVTGEEYTPITKKDEDHRARRITEYLNLVDRIVKKQFEELRNSAFEIGSEITKYFRLLPEDSPLKKIYQKMLDTSDEKEKKQLQQTLRDSIEPGSIDVNIMTKLNTPSFNSKGEKLAEEYSDALAALRGYAQSTLKSAIVFSAGFNRTLYTYAEEFKDFFADAKGFIKKKIVIKVSDYRSAIIQGKFFAKKGIWVSEYRIESGLNCGGHLFASNGFLMGPILEEFRKKKQELIDSLHKVYNEAVKLRDKFSFSAPHQMLITAQGGIGTANEDHFLRDHYDIDLTGWGTAFLAVPEAISIDDKTLKKLCDAKEEDLYLSDVSPVGVPFNNLRDSLSDLARDDRINKGAPGSACPKGHLRFNTEFSERPMCVASRHYQKLKLEQLAPLKEQDSKKYEEALEKVTVKTCICHDLGAGILIENDLVDKTKYSPAVCPGPNMAFFSRVFSLQEMVDHIYGRLNLIESDNRPNMFLKELTMYIDYFTKELKECADALDEKQKQYFRTFQENLLDGMDYYKELFPKMLQESDEFRKGILDELDALKDNFENFISENEAALAVAS